MKSSFNYLIDSDAFVGMVLPSDALHERVRATYQQIKAEQKSLVTTNWVIAETATVLSHKDTQQNAVEFMQKIKQTGIVILNISPEIEATAFQIFCDQTAKRTSMVDCSNVAIAQYYDIANILSFDRFYTRFGYTIGTIKNE